MNLSKITVIFFVDLGLFIIKIIENIATALANFAMKVDIAIQSSLIDHFQVEQLSSSNQNFGKIFYRENKLIVLCNANWRIITISFSDLTIVVGHTLGMFKHFFGELNRLIVAIKKIKALIPALKLL